jgi:hypothetical protein
LPVYPFDGIQPFDVDTNLKTYDKQRPIDESLSSKQISHSTGSESGLNGKYIL